MVRYLQKLNSKSNCQRVFNRLGHTPAQMANLLDSGDNGGSSQGFGRPQAWRAASDVLRGGRRTRKRRGGWRPPDKLQSLSKSKPIRTLKSFKKKKKKKKKKKTRGKRKKRGRKRSRRR